jgi:hypothetical protein
MWARLALTIGDYHGVIAATLSENWDGSSRDFLSS